ncbi:YbhB/YbcL family Raf kinase inhibitor-like protein [Caproicibacter sp.]|uniref:YbhB/YbcL family Raf kinase inhibitor-like protein n=1 Tax=Caproicibacter sp. TaxID=2814884 RepID=UPI003988C7CE
MDALKLTSSAFQEGGRIPARHSGRGENLSPCFELQGIASGAKSFAITLDDASHPLFPNYNHWVIWNLPVREVIPEGIPKGKSVDGFGGAVQGVAYGKHQYKGPKPPFHSIHTYWFTVYVLDCKLDLPANRRKRNLLAAIEGHVLQQAMLSGKFQSRR